MQALLFEKTKVAAYLLWEETQHDNPLQHWYCSEDIACFFEESGFFAAELVSDILRRGIYDLSYIEFIRHIAYRIFIYTNNNDALKNWFAAEKLAHNAEWIESVVQMGKLYNELKTDNMFVKTIRSDKVRQFYVAQGYE